MENFESVAESQFHKRIADFLQEHNLESKYSIIAQAKLSDYTTSPSVRNRVADFMILKGSFPFMIVEVKTRFPKNGIYGEYINRAPLELDLTGADYFAITNLTELIVVNAIRESLDERQEFDEIFNYFEKELTNDEINSRIQEIASAIQESVRESNLLTDPQSALSIYAGNSLLSKDLVNKISYNANGRFFHFKAESKLGLNDFEHRLFRSLLGADIEQAVCRYTTFDTLFHMLNKKTYRMASDIAMNDRSEIDYVDKYLNINYTPLQNLSIQEMKKMNSSYISSCTTIDREDNLTMYRLYAEDSKGVCLTFDVGDMKQSKYMLVQRISYAKGHGNHPELDFLKNIINKISTVIFVKFRLLQLEIWKHFFKTHDYAIEQEVRMLHLEDKKYPPIDKGWVIANPDKILSKFVVFDINNSKFPLKLRKIILGPNCPESELNKRQLEVLLDERGIPNVTVKLSNIESYRKS
jgi:Protein of unknown function (DUF2971)